jgi:hypothetical protein
MLAALKAFVVVFLVFLLATTLLVLVPIEPPAPQNTENTKSDNTPKYYPSSFFTSFQAGLAREEDFIIDWHDETIAIGTIAIACYTIVLGVATQALVKEGRRASKHQLRAYIGIDMIELKAKNLRNKGFKLPDPPPPNHVYEDVIVASLFGDLGDPGESIYYIDPGRTEEAVVVFKQSDHLEAFRDAMDRKISITVYGHVDYVDIFNERWRRDFCFMYEPWRISANKFTPYGRRNRETKIS